MADRLTESDRRALLLLARMPLLWEYAIEQLLGLRGDTSVYRCLARLRAMGLINEMRPALRAGRNPGLFHLTDLGVATIALDQVIDPAHLARRGRLRGADLRGRLRRIDHLVGLYQLLGALASARPGRIDLLAWEQPWRRWFRHPMRRSPVAVEVPACAALSWDDDAAEYLLLPDLATFPLRALHRTLGALISLRQSVGTSFPVLVIATTDDRGTAWIRLLDELARSRRAAPLAARVTTWRELGHGTFTLDDVTGPTRPASMVAVRRLRLRALAPKRPGSPIPNLVGVVCQTGSANGNDPGTLALEVSPMERRLLDLVGRHPFLSGESLAVVLGWEVRRLRQRRARLIDLGLVWLVDASERKNSTDQDLTELTRTGLEVAADQQGLSLARAVRLNGLAGGGPNDPIGMRGLLVRDLEHTLGADAAIVGLYRLFAATGTARDGDAVLEWRSAAACSGRRVRPDGYSMIRRRSELYGFFLEYDRGTMSVRDYNAKWSGYYDYLESRAYERDYDGFPTILVVTTDRTAEERIARSVLAASVGRYPTLPILLTCGWRIDLDPSNPDGLLGRIWRDPYADSSERRGWPVDRLPARPTMVRLGQHRSDV
jgi:hypothetical protein